MAQSMYGDTHGAGLGKRKPILPFGSMSAAKVAFISFTVLISPRQFGPRMRMPCLFADLLQFFLKKRTFFTRLLEAALMTIADFMARG